MCDNSASRINIWNKTLVWIWYFCWWNISGYSTSILCTCLKLSSKSTVFKFQIVCWKISNKPTNICVWVLRTCQTYICIRNRIFYISIAITISNKPTYISTWISTQSNLAAFRNFNIIYCDSIWRICRTNKSTNIPLCGNIYPWQTEIVNISTKHITKKTWIIFITAWNFEIVDCVIISFKVYRFPKSWIFTNWCPFLSRKVNIIFKRDCIIVVCNFTIVHRSSIISKTFCSVNFQYVFHNIFTICFAVQNIIHILNCGCRAIPSRYLSSWIWNILLTTHIAKSRNQTEHCNYNRKQSFLFHLNNLLVTPNNMSILFYNKIIIFSKWK